MEQNLEQTLTEAAKDLLYPSESDYPFEYFTWDLSEGNPLSEAQVRKYTDRGSDTPVKEVPFTDFFDRLTQVKDWNGDEEKRTTEQFAALRNKLGQLLADLRVFRVGTVEIDVYIVGKSPSGKWVGLRTRSVET
ncbi:MAG: nuclease A inhibitor family protein [Cytophagales bacterium]|nr:nuclease A inhibitor family protein [Cytophagales bacterium]